MCGIVGILEYNRAILSFLALAGHHLQHRGQDSCGMAMVKGERLIVQRESGLVSDAWAQRCFRQLSEIKGLGIGHVRYPTVGAVGGSREQQIASTQPFQVNIPDIGQVALVHNGNLTNVKSIIKFLRSNGVEPRSDIDSELALQLLLVFEGTLLERVIKMCQFIKGGFALCILTKDTLIGARDTLGNRPLVLGRKGQDAYMLASETCALDVCDFSFIKEVERGKIVVIKKNEKPYFYRFAEAAIQPRPCIFEDVYFARPDSVIDGRSVTETRIALGKILAKEHPRDVDLVIGVPDSGVLAGYGYAQELGIHFHPAAIVRNHYVGRTFIEPSVEDRGFKQQMKLTVNKSVVKGKRILLVEDSIIRGTVSHDTIGKTFIAGAKEVHIVSACSPFRHPCRTGIATRGYEELIANGCKTVADVEAKVRELTGANSVGFISLAGVYLACGKVYNGEPLMCDACITGDYPVDISEML